MPTKFIALKTFESPEMRSVYVEGLSYTLRDPFSPEQIVDKKTQFASQQRERLAALLPQWIAEGKVAWAVVEPTRARVRGVGEVR